MVPTEEILVASTDLEERRRFAKVLEAEGWDVTCAACVNDCRQTLSNRPVRMILCDFRLPDGTYRDVLQLVRSFEPKVPLVVMSRLADWDEYLDVLRHGAFDLIASHCEPTDLLLAISRTLRDEHAKPAVAEARAAAARASRI
jgi:DNA-binding NtrC family response regulator